MNTGSSSRIEPLWDFTKYRDNTAVIDEHGVKLCYGELEACTQALVKRLEPRSVVLILCSNTIAALLGYVTCLQYGAVPLMLGEHTDPIQLKELLRRYEPEYLWVPFGTQADYREYEEISMQYGYCLLRAGRKSSGFLFSELALLLSTSGSTGSPKLVRISYENLRANTASIVEYLRLDAHERAITTLPMQYTYGLSIINSHLAVGATILLTETSLMQKAFWQFFREQGATSFGGVPYTYEILDRLRFFRMELPTLRTMTQAGGKLSRGLHEKFAHYAQEKNINFIVMYGQCEATARMGYLPAEHALEKVGAMGIAIPGGKFYLLDEAGNKVQSAHTAGELVYEGRNVTLGYAQERADLNKGDERNGVLYTGDLAELDEDGFFSIVGRKKRFLKIFGNRVNLDELGALLAENCDTEVVCAGVDDQMYLFVTDASYADAVKSAAVQKTGLHPSAFQTVVVDYIPKNESGKVQFAKLETYYEI